MYKRKTARQSMRSLLLRRKFTVSVVAVFLSVLLAGTAFAFRADGGLTFGGRVSVDWQSLIDWNYPSGIFINLSDNTVAAFEVTPSSFDYNGQLLHNPNWPVGADASNVSVGTKFHSSGAPWAHTTVWLWVQTLENGMYRVHFQHNMGVNTAIISRDVPAVNGFATPGEMNFDGFIIYIGSINEEKLIRSTHPTLGFFAFGGIATHYPGRYHQQAAFEVAFAATGLWLNDFFVGNGDAGFTYVPPVADEPIVDDGGWSAPPAVVLPPSDDVGDPDCICGGDCYHIDCDCGCAVVGDEDEGDYPYAPPGDEYNPAPEIPLEDDDDVISDEEDYEEVYNEDDDQVTPEYPEYPVYEQPPQY